MVPQDLRNKILKQLVNHQMKGPTLKPRDVYNSQKEKTSQQLMKKPKYHSLK